MRGCELCDMGVLFRTMFFFILGILYKCYYISLSNGPDSTTLPSTTFGFSQNNLWTHLMADLMSRDCLKVQIEWESSCVLDHTFE